MLNNGIKDLSKIVGSSLKAENYMKQQVDAVTPYIIEERQMNMTQIDIYSRLMANRIIFLNEAVRDENMGILCAQYMYLNTVSDKPIQVYINSPGGSVVSGLSLIDIIQTQECRYEPTIMGMGASMGSVIGSIKKLHKDDPKDTITRRMLKNSFFMIHDIRSSGGGGTTVFKDAVIDLNFSAKLRQILFTQLSINSGKYTSEEIEKMCDRDMWLDSSESLLHGFTDEIIQYV